MQKLDDKVEKQSTIGRYDAIDGLRAYSAIGIVLMHVLANGHYDVEGFIFDELIPSFADLVFLFMVISGFSMCCGYYDRILNNKISVTEFYSKRYGKILPFFAFLCLIDIIISPSKEAIYECFANLTLCFGLLPDSNMSVIGVGWFLGLVFVFYLLFPYFCYLLADKRRAWIAFVVTLVFNYICTVYFDADRTNILYSGVFFMTGGLIYLYRDALGILSEKYWYVIILCIVTVAVIFYTISSVTLVMVVLFGLILVYSLRISRGECKILLNRFTKLISNICMEIYLSHMLVFRVIEKLGLKNIFKNEIISYVVSSLITVVFVIAFALVFKKLEIIVNQRSANCKIVD